MFSIKSLTLLFSLVVTFVCASQPSIVSAQQQSSVIKFKGSIYTSKFEMSLQRAGNNLTGSYFYPKSGSANALKLTGKIAPNNDFTMQEFDAAGKQTGEFKGKWKNAPNEAGILLEGEWKKTGGKDTWNFWAYEQVEAFTNGVQVSTKRVNELLKARRIEIEIEYPELSANAQNAAKFNQLIKTMATKSHTEFKQQMLADYPANEVKNLASNLSLNLAYTIEYADNDFISLKFVHWTYTGGAHGNSFSSTINYDLKNGKQLNLEEMFKPGANYLARIAEYCKTDLQTRSSEDDVNFGLAQDMWEDGVAPQAENFQSWNVTKKGLMFSFDPYQVGPYAAGPQTVIMPYAKLKDLLKTPESLTKVAQ